MIPFQKIGKDVLEEGGEGRASQKKNEPYAP